MFDFLIDNFMGGGHQKITIADTVVTLFASALTLIKPTSGTFSGKQATAVYITCFTNPIYFTFDGTAPASDGSTGHPLEVGENMRVAGWDNIKRLKFIRQGTSTGAITVTSIFSTVGVVVPDL